MAPKIFGRLTASTQGGRSFYEQLRGYDDEAGLDTEAGLMADHDFMPTARHRNNNNDSVLSPEADSVHGGAQRAAADGRGSSLGWPHDDEGDEDVPASLLVEPNKATANPGLARAEAPHESQHYDSPNLSSSHSHAPWRPPADERRHEVPRPSTRPATTPYIPSINAGASFNRKNTALWKWANITNLDSFMRDVYDYYEGGGMWCIMVTNALWLL